MLIPALLLTGVLILTPDRKPVTSPTPTLDSIVYHPTLTPEICHLVTFPEPVMPFMAGMEPITAYCQDLPGDPPPDSLIGLCVEGQKITHIIAVKIRDESTGFIPVSASSAC